MKQLLYIFFFVGLGCNAQSSVLPLFEMSDIKGAYYKDINNHLDAFTGTWKYTSGSASLTITLQKKLMQEYQDGSYYFFQDIIVGEYLYFENGVEKANTLSQLLTEQDPFEYSIVGNALFGQGDKYLRTGFTQSDVDIPGMEAAMFFERTDSNGIQKLKLKFEMTEGPVYLESEGPPVIDFALPFGEYILVKQ